MSLISSKSNLSALTAFLWHSIVGLKWLQSQIWYVFYPNVPLWPDAENSIYDLRMVPKNGVGLAKLRSRLLVTNVSVAATWGPPDPNIGAGGEVRKWFPGTIEDWRSVMQESTQLPLREKFGGIVLFTEPSSSKKGAQSRLEWPPQICFQNGKHMPLWGELFIPSSKGAWKYFDSGEGECCVVSFLT